MKTYHTYILLILCSGIATAQPHADLGIGMSTRLRPVLSAGYTQRINNIEIMATASNEFGHGLNAAGSAGIRIPLSNDAGDALVLYAGYGYTWHTEAAKTELQNGYYPMAGIKWLDGWGTYELRYNSNTFQLLLGGRIFNRNKYN